MGKVLERQTVLLGNHQGEVLADMWHFWARQWNGNVIKISASLNCDPVANQIVLIERDGRQWEIVQTIEDYKIPTHHTRHTFGTPDDFLELYKKGLGSQKQKCRYCGQYTKIQEPCNYCGAPN